MTTKITTSDDTESRLDRRGFIGSAATLALGVTALVTSSAHADGTRSGVVSDAAMRGVPSPLALSYWDGTQLKSSALYAPAVAPKTGSTIRVTVTPGPVAGGKPSDLWGLNAYFYPESDRNSTPIPFYAWTAPTTAPVSFTMSIVPEYGLTFGVQRQSGEVIYHLGGKDGPPLRVGTYLIAVASALPSPLLVRVAPDAIIGRSDVLRPIVRTRSGFVPAQFEYLVLHLEEVV